MESFIHTFRTPHIYYFRARVIDARNTRNSDLHGYLPFVGMCFVARVEWE